MLVWFFLAWGMLNPPVVLAVAGTVAAAPREDPPALVVEVSGLSDDPLREELRLHLPERALLRPRTPRPDEPIVYAIVRREGAQVVLTLIMPGGHAYDRMLADEPGQSERVAASGLAALLGSVEAGQVEPSRTQVELPSPEGMKPESTETSDPPVEPPEPTSVPGPEIGLFAGPALGLGLAPRSGASSVLGGGAWFGVDLRLRRGVLVSVDLRILGRGAPPLRLWRFRVAPGVGYRAQVGAFELPVTGHLLVEPWWPRLDSRAPVLVRDGQTARTQPLLGAMVRASPGVFIETLAPGLRGVRLGARLELGGSFVPDQGARTVELGLQQDLQREPLLRLGGLELSMGLELGLWLGRSSGKKR